MTFFQLLWRGVQGELPNAFWQLDAQNKVCAVEGSLISATPNRQTPFDYMGEGRNVLFEIVQALPTDDGFHAGAALSMVSQFAMEDEIISYILHANGG